MQMARWCLRARRRSRPRHGTVLGNPPHRNRLRRRSLPAASTSLPGHRGCVEMKRHVQSVLWVHCWPPHPPTPPPPPPWHQPDRKWNLKHMRFIKIWANPPQKWNQHIRTKTLVHYATSIGCQCFRYIISEKVPPPPPPPPNGENPSTSKIINHSHRGSASYYSAQKDLKFKDGGWNQRPGRVEKRLKRTADDWGRGAMKP
jgi:hypothetical protein